MVREISIELVAPLVLRHPLHGGQSFSATDLGAVLCAKVGPVERVSFSASLEQGVILWMGYVVGDGAPCGGSCTVRTTTDGKRIGVWLEVEVSVGTDDLAKARAVSTSAP